ncbi:uncharacterized protein BJ212DRAFT_212771 [Suillus subaureus]|uniref:Uncharacterized protein n=1 Tax=Suillus subaureus TaxID=48587 RepID=A0A9P7JDF4_9AGAM|nr:uncharacterized protein BJ212DRAFT_212771 [Suillus subaureus]KAG1816132.1 hypothetical protein BJ212DRAFT_212771 [Suillus subaureus]
MMYKGIGRAGIAPGLLKRRKTLGLNTRFDRMLAQVNVTHLYSSDPKTRRKRARSSGSSSISSYDLPKTPVDAYSYEDRLGSDISVLKMNQRASNPAKSPLVQRKLKAYRKGSQVQAPTKSLPMWLASTFSALEPEHPLRELLPPSLAHEDMIEARTRNEPRPYSEEVRTNRMFAFSPFDTDVQENNDAAHGASRPPSADPALCDVGLLPCGRTTVNAVSQTFHLEEGTLGFRPFSTPGSFAALQHTVTSNATPNLACPPESQKTLAHVKPPLLSHDASVNHANFTSSPVFRPTITEPETYLSSFHRGSPVASNDLGSHLPTPDFQENELMMNIFSTPGPAFTVSRPVYFDSPTEDPSLSDPLEPESYELDLDALDFRWQPFLRKTLPDPSLANKQTCAINASATIPPVFEDSDVLLSHLPYSFCGVAGDQVAMAEAPDARVESDVYDGPVRGSLVFGHAIQQSSSPQSNGQSDAVVFTPPSRVFIMAPPIFADSDVLLSHSPHAFRSVADDQATMAEASNASVGYDLRDRPFRNSPISGHAIQESPSPDLNGQNDAVVFAPASGIFISPLQGATSPPAVPGIADVQELTAENTTCITESREQPFTPTRPTQASQPATPKKDRLSQTRSTPIPPRQEQRSTVSWMLSRRSLVGRGGVGRDDIEGLLSQRSDTSHDTIESWTDDH